MEPPGHHPDLGCRGVLGRDAGGVPGPFAATGHGNGYRPTGRANKHADHRPPTATAPADDDETTFGSLAYIGSDGHVYVMRADGSNRVRISEPDPEGARSAHTWPMWSGDGASVLFSRVVVDEEGPRFSLQSVTLGGTPSLVYENPAGAQFVGRNAPHYTNASPDGQYVAFLAVAGNMALLLGDVAGGAPAQSIVQGSPLYYAWTHDSARLLLHLRDSLLLFEPGSDDALTVLDLPPSWSYRAPDWSPDGQRFAFIGDSEQGASLMVANADGSDPRTLAPVSTASAFAWSPDGSRSSSPQRLRPT